MVIGFGIWVRCGWYRPVPILRGDSMWSRLDRFAWLGIAVAAGITAACADAPQKALVPTLRTNALRLTLDTNEVSVPGYQRTARIALLPDSSSLEQRAVGLVSSNVRVATVLLRYDHARATISLHDTGTAVLTATLDGVSSNDVTLTVTGPPPATSALVVEQFGLYAFPDPLGPAGSTSYMPIVRLREPTGRASAALVGVAATMPSAPRLGVCTTNRVWQPGTTADALGLDHYESLPEFSFGPFTPSASIGPVTVMLFVRDAQGALGSITLTKTMTSADITTSRLETMGAWLGCP